MTTLNAPTPAHAHLEAPDASFYVPGKPVSVNRMYGSAPRGQKYLTPDAQAWETLVAYKARSACAELRADIRRGALCLPLRIRCTFYATRCDADNLLKATLDGLKAGLGIDDKHFAQVEAMKADASGTFTDGALLSIWATRALSIETAIARGFEKADRATQSPQFRFHPMQSSLLPGGYCITEETNNHAIGWVVRKGKVWHGWQHLSMVATNKPDCKGATRQDVAEMLYTAKQKEATK